MDTASEMAERQAARAETQFEQTGNGTRSGDHAQNYNKQKTPYDCTLATYQNFVEDHTGKRISRRKATRQLKSVYNPENKNRKLDFNKHGIPGRYIGLALQKYYPKLNVRMGTVSSIIDVVSLAKSHGSVAVGVQIGGEYGSRHSVLLGGGGANYATVLDPAKGFMNVKFSDMIGKNVFYRYDSESPVIVSWR